MPPKTPQSATAPKPTPKTPFDDPPPPAFYEELKKYHALKNAFDEEKMKPEYWDGIPEAPPNQLPKEKPKPQWYDEEINQRMSVFSRPEEEQRIKEIEMDDMKALQKLRDEAEERRKREEEERKEKKAKGLEEQKCTLKVDEDKLVRKLLRKEGLVVPPELAKDVKSLYDV